MDDGRTSAAVEIEGGPDSRPNEIVDSEVLVSREGLVVTEREG